MIFVSSNLTSDLHLAIMAIDQDAAIQRVFALFSHITPRPDLPLAAVRRRTAQPWTSCARATGCL